MVKELTTDRDAFKPTAEQEALSGLQRQLQTEPDDAMTQSEAEAKTGLQGRHKPQATQPYLKCQLGKNVIEPRTYMDYEIGAKVTLHLTFFHVIGWGHSWQRAADNARINRRASK